MFQSIVPIQSGAGVYGDRFDDSPHRALPFALNSANAANNLIGSTMFTLVSQGVAQAGGTGVFVGLLINSKLYALFGTPGFPLAPTLQLPNQTQVELATMGRFGVFLPAAANIGDNVIFNNTTGQISTIPPATSVPVGSTFAYAKVDVYTVTAAGFAVITMTPNSAIS